MSDLPLIGVTSGDPAGIGPEVVVKALCDETLYVVARPFVFGSASIIKDTLEHSGLTGNVFVHASPPQEGYAVGMIHVMDCFPATAGQIPKGELSIFAGRAGCAYIEKAVGAALKHEVDAIATAPINKEAWRMGSVPYIGHTEMLAGLCGMEEPPLVMFQVEKLRLIFMTRHLPLREVPDQITKGRALTYLRRVKQAMEAIGINNPKIALAALNPHASDGGLFGYEEEMELLPAVREACAEGINAVGPIPADSVFSKGLKGEVDVVLSLYHDQGHIAAKTYNAEKTVSINLGLPFIRTSVDHGTAFDIAGKGIASPVSMVEAIKLAAYYATKYKEY